MFTLLRCGMLVSLLGTIGGTASASAAESTPEGARTTAAEKDVTQGALRIIQPDGGVVECPLKHTDVAADVAGFIARVRVTQTFHNPTKEKIEAVYVFPLPHEAAVDEMTMVLGERKIVGIIKRRSEARSIYEAALLAGQTAALLEQERPNIFTQSVGNIEPGQEVKIEIAYVDVLKYDMGTYEFRFPMVVGPRYIPGTPSGGVPPTPAELKGKVSPPVADTDRVPDASRISPPVLKPGVRNGHDISLAVKLNAGVPIQNLTHPNHQAEVAKDGDRAAAIKLAAADSIPNKDFVIRYDVVGKRPEMAILGHTGDYSGDRRHLGNGYFMLMIQPQEDERLTKSPPREIVFLVDVSGSMSGEPTAKVVEAMQGMLKLCREKDTIQVITFASQAHKLFEKPVPVNAENIGKALGFTAGLQGSGGTEMLKGVKLAIDEPIDKERLRIVVMLTDGYIGNEAQIIEHVGKHCGDQIRFWCVGIGSGPNMFLVDGVAKQGGGMGKSLGLKDESQPLVQEIMTRIQRAQLAKINIDWGKLKVSETFPAKIPELWAGRPVIVYGRYAPPDVLDEAAIVEQITVRGNVEGEDVSWPLRVELPVIQKGNDALAKVWARQKIEDLMHQTFYQGSPAVEEMVTGIALDYRLMSQYTSFVAVDDKQAPTAEPARPPRRMLVPVPLPEGTRWEGFFGEGEEQRDRLFSQTSRFKEADKKELAELSKSITTFNRIDRLGRGEAMSRRRSFAAPHAPFAPLGQASLAAARPAQVAGGLGGGWGGFRGIDGRVPAKDSAFGRGGRALQESRFGALSLEKAPALFADLADGEDGYTASVLVAHGGKSAEAARKVFELATGKEAPADRAALEKLLVQACLLDTAAANVGQSDGSHAAQAMERLADLHAKDVKDWSVKLPQLATKLDLVIRDQSLADALAQVAKAAKLDIRLFDGSVDDSAAISGRSPRVSYLDLRRATVAEALDWILQPARLTWRPDGKAIIASSARRSGGESAWVYDVSAVALPLEEVLTKLNDYNKAVAESQKAADEFLAAIRASLKVEDEPGIVWFAPGHLLVFGTPERHAALAKAVAALEEGKTRPEGALGPLSEATRKRFAARKEKLAKAEAAGRKLDVALTHDQFSWQLLSAALAGQLDVEALTELQIAWKSADNAELLAGPMRPLVLRSLWTICESARALPNEKDLAALAASARQQVKAALAAKQEAADGKDPAAIAGALYAVLASPDDRGYRAQLAPLVKPQPEDSPEVADFRLLARLLAHESGAADRASLLEMVSRDLSGPDHVVLLALACRQAGGDHWDRFRAASRDQLGSQPLPGEVVVLVNRLGQSPSELAQAAP
ncbi:MAG: VWA domain-containing protein [Planctomycetaceae bacterium]|nr:VWA domain-containing protein [Planctomycetaceae bacterium]